RLHWIVMLRHIVMGALLILGGIALIYYATTRTDIDVNTVHVMEFAAAGLIIFGAIVIVIGMVRRSSTEMTVTTRRLVIKTGLASRKTIEMLLNKVETIEVSETA